MEALVVEEDMPAHMVVRESLDKRLCGGFIDSREGSGRKYRRGERWSMKDCIQRGMRLRTTNGCSCLRGIVGKAMGRQSFGWKMGRVLSWTMKQFVRVRVTLAVGTGRHHGSRLRRERGQSNYMINPRIGTCQKW